MTPGPEGSATDSALRDGLGGGLSPESSDLMEKAGFILPRYDELSLAAVLPAAAGVLGAEFSGVGGPTASSARTALDLPRADRVCVVLVDGLGLQILSERAGHAPTMRGLLRTGRELTVGFPSTTAASLGVFGTGSTPGRTGMLGYTVRNAQTGRLGNMVSWDGLGEPEDVQREPTVFEALVAEGREVTSVGPRRFADSGLTRAALRGPRYAGVESLADRVDAAAFELTAPGLVYLYWGDIDKVGHHYGWRSSQWGDALSEFDRELGRLLRSVPRGTLILVTADHGMVDVDPALRWDVAGERALGRGVQVVAGEPRATHLHVHAGQDPDDVLGRWREVLGEHAIIVGREEAISQGWFGPVAPHVEVTLPELLVAATGRATIVDSASQSPNSIALKGVHGSMTPGEMLVPLLVDQR